jgi:hypothetical protein
MNTPATNIEHVTNSQSGVPPEPPEAHQRAGTHWVQIDKKDLDRHCLSGEFFISPPALAALTGQGSTLAEVLGWFNAYEGSIAVGDTRQIDSKLQAYFGFDGSKDNGRAFFVEIDVIRLDECIGAGGPGVTAMQSNDSED